MIQGNLTPTELAQRAQYAAQRVLSRRVGGIFEQAFGKNWATQLLERYKGKSGQKRFPFTVSNGKPNWDFAQILYSIIDNINIINNSDRTIVKAICHRLIDGRRYMAHQAEGVFDPNNIEFSRCHINNAISLIDLLGDKDGLTELRGYLDELSKPHSTTDNLVATDDSQQNRKELKEMRAMLEGIVQTLDGLSAHKARVREVSPPPTSRPAQATSAPPPQPAPSAKLPQPEQGLVLFPIVAAGPDAALISDFGFIRCRTFAPEGRQDILARVTGFSLAGRSDSYYQIIGDARFDEDPAKATLHTHARITPGDFAGSSFGLAAALPGPVASYRGNKRL
jgi:hypothetical protein